MKHIRLITALPDTADTTLPDFNTSLEMIIAIVNLTATIMSAMQEAVQTILGAVLDFKETWQDMQGV